MMQQRFNFHADDLDQTLCGTSAEFSTAFLVDKQTEDHKEPSSNIQTKESMVSNGII